MDLNVVIEDCGSRDNNQMIRHKLDRCKALGFHTVALSVVIELQNTSPQVPLPPEVPIVNQLKVYTRLTVKISDSQQLYKLETCEETSKYDILALDPQNATMLQYLITKCDKFDILTLDVSQKLDYSLFKMNYKALEDRGICVEINWGPSQLGSSLRRNIICNGQNLVEKVNKNIIISSGVRDVFRFRGPKDVKSLSVLFMLPTNKCHEAVFRNGTRVINHSKCRVNPISSAIELVAPD